MPGPIRIHPENNKLFEFRGKPLVLLTATEHYGAVLNRPFRMEEYLADAASNGITLTRLFTLFRELQTPINPYSTCKPETPDLVMPFARTGPGRALDRELKFDLDQPNPEFYLRLHRFLALASELGIIVEIVLFSNTYNAEVWSLNPLHGNNNVNDVGEVAWPEYLSQRNAKLHAYQLSHLTRIVTETNRYDNVIYEICNEPGGDVEKGNMMQNYPVCEEVNAWLASMIAAVRQLEAGLPNQHLIAGQEAFSYTPFTQGADLTFRELDYDVVNMHPLPNTVYAGTAYHLGEFMSKQLALRPLRDFCLATYGEDKPLNQDEDNIASQYKDVEGWTIHRKRAWTTLLCGAHYDYIDFSVTIYTPTGTVESTRTIRRWMRILSAFIHSFDLSRAQPCPELVRQTPPATLDVTFGVPNEDICVYLADERELLAARDLPNQAAGDPEEDHAAGAPISGVLVIDLPSAVYAVRCFDPTSGLYAPVLTVNGGPQTHIILPTFTHDLAIRMTLSA